MSDPGSHAIETPAFVISQSPRKVVGGAIVTKYHFQNGVIRLCCRQTILNTVTDRQVLLTCLELAFSVPILVVHLRVSGLTAEVREDNSINSSLTARLHNVAACDSRCKHNHVTLTVHECTSGIGKATWLIGDHSLGSPNLEPSRAKLSGESHDVHRLVLTTRLRTEVVLMDTASYFP